MMPKISKKNIVIADEASRVLVYLFKAGETRDTAAIGNALGLEKAALKYHFNCLAEAKLVKLTGSNFAADKDYWRLTAQGRRYLLRRDR